LYDVDIHPYLRVSTIRQATEGLGLAAQEKAIRSFLRQHRSRAGHFYVDGGVSGAVEDRPALSELLHRIAPGDVVLVARIDRLARDLLVQEVLLADIRKRGGDVASCSPTESDFLADDPHDPTRKLVRQILGAISEFERSLIKLRLQHGRALKHSNGGFAFGSPPFGYRAEGGELAEEPTEQEAIGLALDMRHEGKSLREIGASLTDAGFASKRGGQWYPPTVARMLARAEHQNER
jgi:site-specific DNA recombinase